MLTLKAPVIPLGVTMPPMSKAEDRPGRETIKGKPGGAWRHILMWTAFGLTLVVTVVIVVQAMLLTIGFA